MVTRPPQPKPAMPQPIPAEAEPLKPPQPKPAEPEPKKPPQPKPAEAEDTKPKVKKKKWMKKEDTAVAAIKSGYGEEDRTAGRSVTGMVRPSSKSMRTKLYGRKNNEE